MDVKVDEKFCYNVFSILKRGVELNDGVLFLITVSNCPTF
jgi:hypothetical protein